MLPRSPAHLAAVLHSFPPRYMREGKSRCLEQSAPPLTVEASLPGLAAHVPVGKVNVRTRLNDRQVRVAPDVPTSPRAGYDAACRSPNNGQHTRHSQQSKHTPAAYPCTAVHEPVLERPGDLAPYRGHAAADADVIRNDDAAGWVAASRDAVYTGETLT